MPIVMPTRPGFAACRFGLQTNTQTFESPLTKSVQRVLLGGAYWTATYTLPAMNRDQIALWQAFLASLEGSFNTFDAYDPDARTPRGSGGGTPLVQGGGQTGSTLLTDGWVAHSTPLRIGDYFVVGGELKMVTHGQTVGSDVIADVSGQAYVNFKPALRSSPADNAPLTVENCTVPMVLVDDGQTAWQSGNRLGFYEGMSFSAREVF